MSVSWVNSVDLLLDLRGSRSRAAVEEALREAVVSGRLATAERLPSSRALAAELGLARNTVAEAYAQLVAEGWLVARQGSGTRVAEHTRPTPGPAPAPRPAPPRHDLTTGVPDLSAFPRAAWQRASR